MRWILNSQTTELFRLDLITSLSGAIMGNVTATIDKRVLPDSAYTNIVILYDASKSVLKDGWERLIKWLKSDEVMLIL